MKYVLCWPVSFQSSDWSCLVDEELLYQRNDDTMFYVLGAIIFVLVLLVVVLCVLLCHPKYNFTTSSRHFSASSNLCEPLMFHRSYFSQPKIRLDPRGTWSNMSWTFSPPSPPHSPCLQIKNLATATCSPVALSTIIDANIISFIFSSFMTKSHRRLSGVQFSVRLIGNFLLL